MNEVDALVSAYLDRLAEATTAAGLPADRAEELRTEVAAHIDEARASGAVSEAEIRDVLDRLGTPSEIVTAAAYDMTYPPPPAPATYAGQAPGAPETYAEPPPGMAYGTPGPGMAYGKPGPAMTYAGGPTPDAKYAAPEPGMSYDGPVEPRLRSREVGALLLLLFGGFVLAIGWFAGVMLLWASNRWTTAEKLLATLIWPFGYASVVLFSTMPGQVCTGGGSDEGGVPYAEVCTGFALPTWLGIPILILLVLAPLAVVGLLIRRAAPNRAS
ncbi:HAAS signaling domain-containing protein [Kribbella deserti]|uniref:DUF1700 domain-containing protein n=1 Tax=Kribbella deserti TaxID=1926257 RepID=A0ABV6QUH7_9ACTN